MLLKTLQRGRTIQKERSKRCSTVFIFLQLLDSFWKDRDKFILTIEEKAAASCLDKLCHGFLWLAAIGIGIFVGRAR